VSFDADAMRAGTDDPLLAATDLAELLVRRGTPFREAHAVVGGLVRDSIERHVPLSELVGAHPDLGDDAVALLTAGVAVTRRTTPGGAGPGPVAVQRESFRARLALDRERLDAI
jgi:argininosuccinate lyase